MGNSDERRKYSRLPLELKCEVKTLGIDSMTIEGVASNISFKGLFFKYENPPMGLNEECLVHIQFGDPKTSPIIRGSAKVIHVEKKGIGFEFTNLAYSSFQHLKDLLVHRSEDPDRVEGEIEKNPPKNT